MGMTAPPLLLDEGGLRPHQHGPRRASRVHVDRRRLRSATAYLGSRFRCYQSPIEKLAYEMGISKGNLCDIEHGKRDPRYTTLRAIAEGLDLSIAQLLRDL